MNDFLQLQNEKFLVFGVANKKSVAYHITKNLLDCGARCVLVVLNDDIRQKVAKIFPEIDEIYCCNVEKPEEIERLQAEIAARHEEGSFDGLVHSIAFADYSDGMKPFHETRPEQFLQAVNISCFSLTTLSNAFKTLLSSTASVVTISISTTRMASESYGYMGPIKAALDSSLAFLAKSFSAFSEIRFNAVAPGLLKTSASAGIPGYVDSYLYAEHVIPRGRSSSYLLHPALLGHRGQRSGHGLR